MFENSPENDRDSDDDYDFTWDDAKGDDDSWEEDLEDTPLALRAKKKRLTSNSKRKRGRPKKVCPKVPPLRIKAIKPGDTVESTATSDSADTKYEIRDDASDAQPSGNTTSVV